MRSILWSGFICWLFIEQPTSVWAQIPTREQLAGTWIGIQTEWSPTSFCPLPTYLHLKADSTYHLGMVDGSAAEQTSTWSVQGERIRLDTIHFAPRLITLEDNLLRIGNVYPMVFRRFQDIAVDSAQAYQQLAGRVWQSDSLTMYLYGNGKVALEHPITNQRTVHFWRLARFGNSLFLIIRGNQYTSDGTYKPLWQISRSSAKQLEAIGWHGRAVTSQIFRWISTLSPADSCRPSGFQLCDNCFRSSWNKISWGRSPTQNEITQLFNKYYQAGCQAGQSGLVHIRFDVNCAGEQGNLAIRGYGEDYRPKAFDPQIITQLLTICRDRIAAIAPQHDVASTADYPQDTAVSLTFRLHDGQLIAILL